MSLTPEQRDNLSELLWAVREETLSPEQAEQLERLVLGSEDARRIYVETTNLWNSLRWREQNVVEMPEPRRSPVLGFLGDCMQQTGSFLSRPSPLSLLVATVTIGTLLTILAVWAMPTYRQWTASRRPRPEPPMVARLVRTVDCLWAKPASAPAVGAHLPMGKPIRLRAGLAEIAFASGARVIVEGPVALDLLSEGAGFLRRGRLTVKVPAKAVGFTIKTPSTVVVDLGTEFGVYVGLSGASTVAVFCGTVEVECTETPPKTTAKRKLVAGEQVRIAPNGRLLEKTSSSDKFVRSLPTRTVPKTILKADIAPNESTPVQPGFEPLVIGADEVAAGRPVTRSFGKLEVTLVGVGVSLHSRDRPGLEATDEFTETPLLRDLVFAYGGAADTTGMDIVLKGLVPGRRYVVTIWSSDVSSEGTRVSDWSAGGVRANDNYTFSYEVLPKTDKDRRFSFLTAADASGKITLEARRDETSYVSDHGPQPAVFLNGLQIQEASPSNVKSGASPDKGTTVHNVNEGDHKPAKQE